MLDVIGVLSFMVGWCVVGTFVAAVVDRLTARVWDPPVLGAAALFWPPVLAVLVLLLVVLWMGRLAQGVADTWR